MDVSSHTSMLPAGDVPEWVHLIPAGTFSGNDGRGPYKLPANVQGVIAASMTAGKLPIDENHSTQLGPVAGNPSPARGWIVALEARADGLWGKPEWNASGQALMAERAYRGISPVYTHTKDGTITRIISAALTNAPNLKQLSTLHTANPHGEHMDIAKIRTALGLPGDADEGAVLTAITAQKETVSRHTAEIAALKAQTVPVAEVVALQTQMQGLQAAIAHEKAEAFVDAAIKAGKPLTAVREQLIAMHVQDPKGAADLVAGMPVLNAGGMASHAAKSGDGQAMMTDMDKAVMKRMGISASEYAAYKKKLAEKEGDS